ncbi:PhnD/SsuA/transferrin family substrate-binding protein [Alkalihalobacillus oceani]|uniref:PhnD/SsuA/transferrin family substrate-binding protein n=1 Tax=Halalkalibacter oceani TaxID=1653776 RepID=UPI002042352B|nr:PhnD/SsuA/transferrin family substrate-binding protein [Halalkalibacter oceani]MCM3762211.1 PhnD/SsuA/transferrin family substrate-binding protein [Halalkalibacter oceani]
MKKSLLYVLTLVLLFIAGCSSSGTSGQDSITIAWLPNESGTDLTETRDEIGRIIEEQTGAEVTHQTTTDYIIAIEAIANGNADMAYLGAVGYIEAKNRNDQVHPLVVPSGESGTLDDAIYYSWLAVEVENADEYKNGDEFAIDNIEGKRFSFVSNSSTSGFRVPSTGIVDYFSEQPGFEDLTPDDLLEGGDNHFFSDVLYGGSHQGSAVNLLSGNVDVAAFCDTCVNNYVELVEGEENRPGSIYRVREDAVEPFNTVSGKEFILISVTPVLNAPFVINGDNIDEEMQAKLLEVMTSDEVANNERIFAPADSDISGLFSKTADERLIEVEDAWFDPIRELSN